MWQERSAPRPPVGRYNQASLARAQGHGAPPRDRRVYASGFSNNTLNGLFGHMSNATHVAEDLSAATTLQQPQPSEANLCNAYDTDRQRGTCV